MRLLENDSSNECYCFLSKLIFAIDNNIICYDADAPNGEYTHRLESLLKTIAYKNAEKISYDGKDPLEFLYCVKLSPKHLLYYKEEGCELPRMKENVVLAIFENGCLLGSY